MFFSIIGGIAAFLTSTGFVPQIFKAIKTKRASDLSLTTLSGIAMGTALWTIYGLYLNDKIIVFANVFTFSTVVLLLVLKAYFEKNG